MINNNIQILRSFNLFVRLALYTWGTKVINDSEDAMYPIQVTVCMVRDFNL
jgi:hypothetical protein